VIWYENGKATLGPIQPYTPLQVTEADRRSYVEEMKDRGAMATSISMTVGGAVTRVERRAVPVDPSNLVFAETKPPFLMGVHATPDGEVWVLRTRPAGDSIPRYDVFDRQGNLKGQVTLNPSSEVFAFGQGTVYVLRIDDDDLQHLQRFRR
jgi:hypothetical protein